MADLAAKPDHWLGNQGRLTEPMVLRAGAGQYLLTTIRSHDQFNTSIYGLDDRYRGIYNGRRVIFMNEADLAAEGCVQGHLVGRDQSFCRPNPDR